MAVPRYITYEGHSWPVKFWANNLSPHGVGPKLIRQRLDSGWSTKDAILTPTAKAMRGRRDSKVLRVEFEGKMLTYHELAAATGWAGNTLRKMVHNGKPITYKVDAMKLRAKHKKVFNAKKARKGKWDNPMPRLIPDLEYHATNLIRSGLSDEEVMKRLSHHGTR